jgi:hypothetical protein
MKIKKRLVQKYLCKMGFHDFRTTMIDGFHSPYEKFCTYCGTYRHRLVTYDDWFYGRHPRNIRKGERIK